MRQGLRAADAKFLAPLKLPLPCELVVEGRAEYGFALAPVLALGCHGPRQDRRWATAWSPEQIARRLPVNYPDDETMRISHEAIYQALYVQSRGALRRELTAYLRTGRALRVPRARTRGRGKFYVTPEILISRRPAEAASWAVPGTGKATSSSA